MRVAVMAKPTPDNWDMSFSSDSDPFSSDSDPFGDPFDFAPKVEEEAKTGKISLTKRQIIFNRGDINSIFRPGRHSR